MIELFFVTCLISDPEDCKPHRVVFQDEHGAYGCMLQAQFELVRWIEDHPAEKVRLWQCRRLGGVEREV